MKKRISFFMAAVFLFAFAACGQAGRTQAVDAAGTPPASTPGREETPAQGAENASALPEAPEAAAGGTGGKVLIVYFSWSPSGNTEKIAAYIQAQTGGDLLKLEPVSPYPADYGECAEVAKAERDGNARPEIANLPESIEEYDTVFVGYPIWWHTAPMIIGSFLESYDLTGVQLYPFSQSDSMDAGQFDNSMAFVRENAAGASVQEGLFAQAEDTGKIQEYLTENGFAAQAGDPQ